MERDPALQLRLIQLDETWREAFVAMVEDYRAAGEPRYDAAARDFAAYLGQLVVASRSEQPPGFVPSDVLFLADGTELVGSIRLRHHLLPHLEREGGHVGYDVRPTRRGRGLATAMLALVLEVARARGMQRLLITCDADNSASVRVIEKSGGQLENQITSERTGKLVNRYWVPT